MDLCVLYYLGLVCAALFPFQTGEGSSSSHIDPSVPISKCSVYSRFCPDLRLPTELRSICSCWLKEGKKTFCSLLVQNKPTSIKFTEFWSNACPWLPTLDGRVDTEWWERIVRVLHVPPWRKNMTVFLWLLQSAAKWYLSRARKERKWFLSLRLNDIL